MIARPMNCSCDNSGLTRAPKNTLASYTIQELPDLPEKAKIFPGTGTIQVDRRFWRGLSALQRQAVLAHELAHDEDPSSTCESCTDARAGARLRFEGVSASGAVDALASVVGGRRAGEPLLYGWQLADQAIRERRGQRASVELHNAPGNVAAKPPPSYGLDDGGQSFGSPDGFEDEASQTSFGTPEGITGGSEARAGSPFSSGSKAPPPSPAKPAPFPVAGALVAVGAVIIVIAIVRSIAT